MTYRNYKVGQNRYQTVLLPPSTDEYVSEQITCKSMGSEQINGVHYIMGVVK